MEDASKALIMGAGVLITLMVLSLAVYLVITFGSFSAQIHNINEENELLAFNSQFSAYQDEESITIYDIVTVVNFARENNELYGLTSGTENNYYVQVSIKGKYNNLEQKKQSELDVIIKSDIAEINSHSNKLPKYTCTEVKVSKVTGRVYKITFEKNE